MVLYGTANGTENMGHGGVLLLPWADVTDRWWPLPAEARQNLAILLACALGSHYQGCARTGRVGGVGSHKRAMSGEPRALAECCRDVTEVGLSCVHRISVCCESPLGTSDLSG